MPVTQLSPFRSRVLHRFQTLSGQIFSAKMSTYRRAHTRKCCGVGFFIYLSVCLVTALHHPCFGFPPLLGLVCFILASKKERDYYKSCRGFCWVGYSQISGMCYQLMPGFTLWLRDLCTFRNEWKTISSSCMTPWNVLRHQCHVVPLWAVEVPSVPEFAGCFLELNDVYWVLRSTNVFFNVSWYF